jgi:hypothetical protein
MNAAISFEYGRLYVEPRESVLFFARRGEERIRCYVTKSALVKRFRAKDDAANAYKYCLCAYDRNSAEIQATARRLLEENRLAADRTVVVSPEVIADPEMAI